MTLQQLRYLVSVADHQTMTRAAAEAHVAQSVLTRAVRALERELGLQLLVRRGRGVELTDDGRRVVEAARRVLAEVALIERLGRTRPGDARTIASVASTPTLEVELTSTLAPRYYERYPGFNLSFVHCGSRQEVAEAVLHGRVDVGVCDLPVPDELEVTPLEDKEVVVIAPPGMSLPDPLPEEMLAELPLILPTPTSLRRAAFDGLFAALDIEPRIALETDERASWIPAVLSGIGCCVWYRAQGNEALRSGAVVRSLDPPRRRTVALVQRRGMLSDPAAAFVRLAREVVSHSPSTAATRSRDEPQ